ncbi:hypothetical protein BgAZ_501730 [Babesia gibsoni]|uniref:Mcm6 C-terminal winged-helix domain-containing protein n=1 Tax=Babesia gibsoni TaxID=33632 RepID=A0AAD8PD88_BABGI|nr:hypothetical protein BgAZ_501730 [Babesia gibsoni]
MTQLDVPSNLNVSFGAYVHFAYYIGKYLMQHCEDESCEEGKLVNWYLSRFKSLLAQTHTSESKLRMLYGTLINNVIRDDCVIVVSETPEGRILKRHPDFFVWAWRSQATSHESSIMSS